MGSQDDVRGKILERVRVTRLHVEQAKAFILDNFVDSTDRLLTALLREYDAKMPDKVIIHPDVPLEPQISQVAISLIWQIAFAEAVWQLIGSGVLLPKNGQFRELSHHVSWTTVYQRSGGMSSGWQFSEFDVAVPSRLQVSVSWQCGTSQPLADTDLFLSEIGISGLHQEVEIALREAIRCLKHNLYLPSLAMLTKAIEGSWIELGLALLSFASGKPGFSVERAEKVKDVLVSPEFSLFRKMRDIVQLYEQQNIFRELKRSSGVTPSMLQSAYVWSDTVREARNAIHYGKDVATPLSYESVAILLLGAGRNLRNIYALLNAARNQAG